MGQNPKTRKGSNRERVIEKTDALLALLERVTEIKDLKDTQSYEDLKSLKTQIERRDSDPELVTSLSSALSDLTQRIVNGLLKDKQLARVKVTRISPKQGGQGDPFPSIVGWEVYRPRVGRRYKVFKEDGGIFITSPVTKLLTGYVQTMNSVYQVDVLMKD